MGGQQESDREYPQEPVEGVGGVIFRGDRVLLVRRAKPPKAGAWSLPGGAREPGESAEETFSREIREETGLDLKPRGFVETVEFIEHDDTGAVRYHYSLEDYWSESPSGEAAPGSDVSEVVWAPLAALDPYGLWDKTVEVIHKAAALRAKARPEKPRHSLKGHLKTAGIAVLFGMAAYAGIHFLIWILKTLGIMTAA